MVELSVNSVLSRVKNQLYAAIIANCIIFSHGTNMGFFSPSLPLLLSDDTPLKTGPITNEQLSWLGAMNSVGSIVGTFIVGAISALMGSKRAMTFIAYPTIAFWLLIYFGDTFYHILIARFCGGLTGGGMQSGVVLYISEISNDNVRGRLGSILPLARNSGMLIAFIAGALVKYEHRPYVFICIPIVYLVWVSFLPNSVQFYLKKDSFEQAEKSLMFYKSCDGKNESEKAIVRAEFERLKLLEVERKRNSKIQMKDICNRLAFKGITTSIAMSWFMQTTGAVIIMNYASLIFEISGSILSIDASCITLAILQIFGGLVSTQLGDMLGRKTTLTISLAASAFGLFTFTIYSYFRQNGYDVSHFLWLPLICLSFIIFISSAGIVALANTCTVENFPQKIRPIGMIFYSLMMNGVALLGEKFFPVLVKIIYMHGFLLFLGINCCLGIIFVAFMKETKGQSIHEPKSDKKCSPDKNKDQQRF